MGCDKRSDAVRAGSGSDAAASADRPNGERRAPARTLQPNERVEVPGGPFRAGSVPGQPGRDPELEPTEYEVELGPFRIDRLFYPNDPTRAPLTGVTRKEALRLCAERDGRLCTELEWERACRGPGSENFASGSSWEPRCLEDFRACASGFDVAGMGTLREWVASDVLADGGKPKHAVVKGAGKQAETHDRRCARRAGLSDDAEHEDLGFRCCAGAPNAAKVSEPELGQTFDKANINAKDLQDLLRADPHTERLAKDIVFFREPEAAHTVVARGPGDTKGFSFTVSPLVWNPVAGSRFLLVAARSGEKTSFVVAYHLIANAEGKRSYKLASSFVMLDEIGPVAFAYSGYIRPRLHFSTCWGCPGETGKILHRSPDNVVILQP